MFEKGAWTTDKQMHSECVLELFQGNEKILRKQGLKGKRKSYFTTYKVIISHCFYREKQYLLHLNE